MAKSVPEVLSALLQASPDAVIVVDGLGRIEMATPATESLFGWPPDDLVGQPVELLIPEDLRSGHVRLRDTYIANPRARAMGSGLNLWGQRRDGSTVRVEVSLVPLTLDGVVRVGAFVRDATERRRWADAQGYLNEISHHLLAGGDSFDSLALTAERAMTLVDGEVAWVVTPGRRSELVVVAAVGHMAQRLLGAQLPGDTSLSARTMAEGRPIIIRDMANDPAVLAEARALGLGPGLYLPLIAEDRSTGALVVARLAGRPQFEQTESDALEMFASAAALALSLDRARQDVERLRLVSEEERIARDLHDTVIQRLFAIGMSLQSAEQFVEGPPAERLQAAVDAIDEVIREIRETIFDLNRPDTGGPGIRQHLRELAEDVADQLGFEPRVGFRGPVESSVADEIVPHLLAVAREGLSNTARHARATTVDVVLEATDHVLRLTIADDGAGLSDSPSAGHGIANMEQRARQLGGEFALVPRHPSGTLLRWQIPSRSASPGSGQTGT